MTPREQLEQLITAADCNEYQRSVIDDEVSHRGVQGAIDNWDAVLLQARLTNMIGG